MWGKGFHASYKLMLPEASLGPHAVERAACSCSSLPCGSVDALLLLRLCASVGGPLAAEPAFLSPLPLLWVCSLNLLDLSLLRHWLVMPPAHAPISCISMGDLKHARLSCRNGFEEKPREYCPPCEPQAEPRVSESRVCGIRKIPSS